MFRPTTSGLGNSLALVVVCALMLLVGREAFVDAPWRARLGELVEHHELLASRCRDHASEPWLTPETATEFQGLADWFSRHADLLRRSARPDVDEEEQQVAARDERVLSLSLTSRALQLNAEIRRRQVEIEELDRRFKDLEADPEPKPRAGGRIIKLLHTPSPGS